MHDPNDLTLPSLRARYASGRETPQSVLDLLFERSRGADERHIWITRLDRTQVMTYAAALDPRRIDRMPLYGVPFVIKDNIDLSGVATTAGCASFAYVPPRSATVVQRLIDAGAIPLGKTNLDQFATGLVGARSPYGACRNSVDSSYIAGGSSSGSAVAVATGLASFALGTDTAGSGRVPAAFNNLIGLKPSNGRLSTRGVVPACRSLDCVSIFALTAEDAAEVLDAAGGFDEADPYSRVQGNAGLAGLRCGVPHADQLQFFGDTEYARLFELAVQRLEAVGGSITRIDFGPFLEAARLLYEGPWIAERYAAVGAFIDAHPDEVHPVTRQIIQAGKAPTAAAAFQGAYRLRALARRSARTWSDVDILVTPTAGTIYRLADVLADPLRLNANLGYYTNFMNLLDLCGVSVPSGFRHDGLPFGITLVGPRGTDHALLEIAGRLRQAAEPALGAAGAALRSPSRPETPHEPAPLREGFVMLAVCGAHMQGLPLNHQLRNRGAYLMRTAATAPRYRLFLLPGAPPRRPGLIRVPEGSAIALEIWALPTEQVGAFIAGIPAPLGLGRIELDSGGEVAGFLCENYATNGAEDITGFGGWRAYLERSAPGRT